MVGRRYPTLVTDFDWPPDAHVLDARLRISVSVGDWAPLERGTRIFRVGAIRGYQPQSGCCESYRVREELPLAAVLSPPHFRAEKFVQRIERLTLDQVAAAVARLLHVPESLSERRGAYPAGRPSSDHQYGRRIWDAVMRLAQSDASLYQVNEDTWDGYYSYSFADPGWQRFTSICQAAVQDLLCGDERFERTVSAALGAIASVGRGTHP